MPNLTVRRLPTGFIEITSSGGDSYTIHGELEVRKDTASGTCRLYHKGNFRFSLNPAGSDGVVSVFEDIPATEHPVTDLDTLYNALILIFTRLPPPGP